MEPGEAWGATPVRTMADSARDRMIGELGSSATSSRLTGDAASKRILVHGCDPAVAARACQMLPPLLGNVQMVSSTDNSKLFAELAAAKFDAVAFAPGACRYAAAGKPIPGGNAETQHWSLEEYKAKVREAQGPDVPIVTSTEERLLVPLLREAPGLHAS